MFFLSAVTRHRTPWITGQVTLPAFDEDVWELYDGTKDWTQAHDASKQFPDKLRELQRLWLIEATKYNVMPLDDRFCRTCQPRPRRPAAMIKGNSQLLFAGMGRLSENSVISIKNKSFSITAEIVVPKGVAEGVIIHQGGYFGGWSFYAKSGKAKFAYNLFAIEITHVGAERAIPTGKHQVRMEFAYDGADWARAAPSRCSMTGRRSGRAAWNARSRFAFSADETADVGRDTGTPAPADYDLKSSIFTGTINWVQIDTGKDDHGNLISPKTGCS